MKIKRSISNKVAPSHKKTPSAPVKAPPYPKDWLDLGGRQPKTRLPVIRTALGGAFLGTIVGMAGTQLTGGLDHLGGAFLGAGSGAVAGGLGLALLAETTAHIDGRGGAFMGGAFHGSRVGAVAGLALGARYGAAAFGAAAPIMGMISGTALGLGLALWSHSRA